MLFNAGCPKKELKVSISVYMKTETIHTSHMAVMISVDVCGVMMSVQSVHCYYFIK